MIDDKLALEEALEKRQLRGGKNGRKIGSRR